MKLIQNIHSKLFLGVLVAVLGFVGFAPSAEATSYHYGTTPYYYSYQQPTYYYQYQTNNTANLLAQLRSLQAELARLQSRYYVTYGHSYSSGYGSGYRYRDDYRYDNRYYDYYDIDVDTLYARNVRDDEATLYGEVDFGDADYVDVWFEYGEDGDLDDESDEERLYEDDDDERFSIEIDGLDEDEHYYFRAVAEAPNGERVYGQIRSFTSDDDGSSSDDDAPEADTRDADDVTDDSAELRGSVDMNDFNNGIVFFVWGEDEDQVEDVEDEDRYSDIDEDGDDLQKYRVDTDLDDDRSYTLEVNGLDDNTDYYFRICVEYEDEDDDERLECGEVERFETD